MSQSGSDFRSCVGGGWIGGIGIRGGELSEETVASVGVRGRGAGSQVAAMVSGSE